MEPTDVIQLVMYATSILVCAALTVYFLREFLNNKRLRVPLWWATGFLLSAFGILVMSVTALYVLHKILVMLAFATTTAASFAFLYYAASTLFFCRKSFFKEIFTVILFIVSFVLFLLPEYLHQREHMVGIIRSPMMVLFVVAFLVLALVYTRVVKELHKRYSCKRVVALQSLTVWILGVWSLYIASSWGSIMAVGLVFVLSLVGFILLWYYCIGGDHMSEEDKKEEEKYREFCIQSIDGVEYKIKRKADIIRERLHNAMQEIGIALLYTMKTVDETGRNLLFAKNEVDENGKYGHYTIKPVDKNGRYMTQDVEEAESNFEEQERKNKMVVYASTIGMKEDELVARIVDLMENIFELARSAYEVPNPCGIGRVDFSLFDGGNETDTDGVDTVPLDSACGDAGEESEGTQSAVSVNIEKLAKLTFFRSSTDRDMIWTCCDLVIGVCDMENDAVTKIRWEELPREEHPRGMIGHTYNILRYYDEKTKDEKYTYSQVFREKFQGRADKYLNKSDKLRKDAFEYKVNLQSNSESKQAEKTIEFLEDAIDFLKDSIDLLKDASDLIKIMFQYSQITFQDYGD